MENKRSSKLLIPVLLGLIVILVLSGCTRSKSTATVAVGTAASDVGASVPTSEAAQEGMGIFESAPTPTLAGGEASPHSVDATPLPEAGVLPAATATPEAQGANQPLLPVEAVPPTAVVPLQALPTAGPNPATYTLQKGEHPFCIARRYNVDQYEMLSVNGLGNNTVLAPGVVLKLPTTGNPFVSPRALKAHPAEYRVTGGETIDSIACAFGDVRPEMIAAANNLSAPYTLTAGTVLNIP